MAQTSAQFAAEKRATLPAPGRTPIDHLRHTAAAFAAARPDSLAIQATSNVYGRGVRTGLTYGDLRKLVAVLDELYADFEDANGNGSSNDVAQALDDWFTKHGYPTVLYREK